MQLALVDPDLGVRVGPWLAKPRGNSGVGDEPSPIGGPISTSGTKARGYTPSTSHAEIPVRHLNRKRHAGFGHRARFRYHQQTIRPGKGRKHARTLSTGEPGDISV